MGRIRTTLVKRTARELMNIHGDELTDNFKQNQATINNLINSPSKILKNKIAGCVTNLVKKKAKEKESEY